MTSTVRVKHILFHVTWKGIGQNTNAVIALTRTIVTHVFRYSLTQQHIHNIHTTHAHKCHQRSTSVLYVSNWTLPHIKTLLLTPYCIQLKCHLNMSTLSKWITSLTERFSYLFTLLSFKLFPIKNITVILTSLHYHHPNILKLLSSSHPSTTIILTSLHHHHPHILTLPSSSHP